MKKLKKWFWNILIAVDQLGNALLMGDPDETISSRMGKKMRSNSATPIDKGLCKVLDKIDGDHCEESIEDDEGKDGVN